MWRYAVYCLFILFVYAYLFVWTPVLANNDLYNNVNEILANTSFTNQWTTLVDALLWQQETMKVKRELISQFCDTVLQVWRWTNVSWVAYRYQDFVYDPKQSLFVYALCVNIDEANKGLEMLYKPKSKKNPTWPSWQQFDQLMGGESSSSWYEPYPYRGYKKLFDDLTYEENGVSFTLSDYLRDGIELNQIWGIPLQAGLDAENTLVSSRCNPKTSMSFCNMAGLLPTIFSHILNDYTNIRLAALYGYQFVEQSTSDGKDGLKRQKAVQKFSQTYFGDDLVDGAWSSVRDLMMPCNDPDIWYLYPSDVEGSNAKHCSHPKTYALVEWTIKSATKLLKKAEFLDGEKIMAEECQDAERGTLLLRCAFTVHGNTSRDGDRKVFKNLLLNEYLRYNLFVTYYSQMILYDPAYHPLSPWWSVTRVVIHGIQEYTALVYEQQLTHFALHQAIRLLQQVGVYYPLHIWLSAYLEDLINLRKTIAKPFTPLDQLSYKFRNVQACME